MLICLTPAQGSFQIHLFALMHDPSELRSRSGVIGKGSSRLRASVIHLFMVVPQFCSFLGSYPHHVSPNRLIILLSNGVNGYVARDTVRVGNWSIVGTLCKRRVKWSLDCWCVNLQWVYVFEYSGVCFNCRPLYLCQENLLHLHLFLHKHTV